jgi:hypothetical protein
MSANNKLDFEKEMLSYNKLDNTLCLNSQVLNFNIDEDGGLDCKDYHEMIHCLEDVEKHLIKGVANQAMLDSIYREFGNLLADYVFDQSFDGTKNTDIQNIRQWLLVMRKKENKK